MRLITSDRTLSDLEKRVKWHAADLGRTLPEIRFFILDRLEFASLLEKHVYPTSPSNIWEGKRMVTKKLRIETGQESSIYYEVVQTGNPSYAYLNNTNSPMMQASVMAHVVGHCEFSELNVLKDSNPDRTEYVMHLVRKVNLGRQQMGEKNYGWYWNAVESVIPLIAPHSQYNLERSVQNDSRRFQERVEDVTVESPASLFHPYSHTMDLLLQTDSMEDVWKKEMIKKDQQEQISRKGFRLYQPCQDILGFLRLYAPASQAERAILDYLYVSHSKQDFVIRTQIMNEGWAMYWEKKIMLRLFEEKAVKGIIDYARVFSGVCAPRPFFNRNPYHLGYHLWNHIEELLKDGKVSLDYLDEVDQATKDRWKNKGKQDPMAVMEHLIKSVTDYEFLRRFLTAELIEAFHLNRINKAMVEGMGIPKDIIVKSKDPWVWLDPKVVKQEMLLFFTHFQRPRIYLIDTDYIDGGLLLFHRNDGRTLKKDWIKPTLRNLHFIWKGAVSLMTSNTLFTYSDNSLTERQIEQPTFDVITERVKNAEKPFVA